MKKVKVIFGGAFNPPTIAHLAQAQQILNQYPIVESIVFVPVGDLYEKEGLIEAKHRVAMLEKVCEDNKKFELSTVEVESPKLLKTIDTLGLLTPYYPEHELWFATGTENLREFNIWKEPERLISNFKFLIIERDKDNAEEIIKDNEVLNRNRINIKVMKDNIRTNISSTLARKITKSGQSCRYLVVDKVFKYINENDLYKSER